jgi:hypothetical protein
MSDCDYANFDLFIKWQALILNYEHHDEAHDLRQCFL